VATTLNYLDIKTVVVSCGTCMDQLQKYEFDKIFPGCRLLDIHEYLLEKGLKLDGVQGVRYMYHDPCHTPMKTYAPLKVVNELMGRDDIALNDRCCGESGTFAASRPDIATQVRFRKEEQMRKGAAAVRADGFAGPVKVLTSCRPACRACIATTPTRTRPPTTSWWRWRATSWARTGWRSSSRRRATGASSGCCCKARRRHQ
jgi:Fe-S oxidoreductase